MSNSSKKQNIVPFQTNRKTLWFLLLDGGIVGVFAIEIWILYIFQCLTELLSSRLVFKRVFRIVFLTQRPVLNSNSTANIKKILLPCTTSVFPAVLTYCDICLELFFFFLPGYIFVSTVKLYGVLQAKDIISYQVL